ncbi:MAG: hypothetical protein ACE5IQ_03300 [Candidatus Methylomirabilales bacterium]
MRTLDHASSARVVPNDEGTGISPDRRLPTLIRSLFQPPPHGMIALLRGSRMVIPLATFAAGLYALKRQKVLLVDAGNSTDPYIVSRLALAARQDPEPVLSRIHVIRTFTVHQLAALAFHRLMPFIRDHAPGLVILSGATSLFADANVPYKEASWLLKEIAAEVKRQAEGGCKVLVAAADAPVESGRRNLHLPWLHVASRSIRVDPSMNSGQGPSTGLPRAESRGSGQALVFRHEKPLSRRIETVPMDHFLPFV